MLDTVSALAINAIVAKVRLSSPCTAFYVGTPLSIGCIHVRAVRFVALTTAGAAAAAAAGTVDDD